MLEEGRGWISRPHPQIQSRPHSRSTNGVASLAYGKFRVEIRAVSVATAVLRRRQLGWATLISSQPYSPVEFPAVGDHSLSRAMGTSNGGRQMKQKHFKYAQSREAQPFSSGHRGLDFNCDTRSRRRRRREHVGAGILRKPRGDAADAGLSFATIYYHTSVKAGARCRFCASGRIAADSPSPFTGNVNANLKAGRRPRPRHSELCVRITVLWRAGGVSRCWFRSAATRPTSTRR